MKKIVLTTALTAALVSGPAHAGLIGSIQNQRNLDSGVAVTIAWTARCVLSLFTVCDSLPAGGRN